MKKIALSLLLGLPFLAAYGQTHFSVNAVTPTETTLQLSFGEPEKTLVNTPQGPAYVISMDQGTPLLQAGAPDVPKITAPLMIPDKGKMQVEILDAVYQDIEGIAVAPSKGNLLRTVDPATLPFDFGTIYSHDGYFPGVQAALQDPFILRDVRGQSLWVYPIQYNPVTRVMRVYSSMTVRVYATSEKGENERKAVAGRTSSTSFDDLYRKFFVNFKSGSNTRGAEAPEKMLVIAKDEFVPLLEPYVAWKRQMGIHTTVVPASETGGSPSSLFSYVKNYYDQEHISYLLLVGDEYAITPMVRPGSNYSCDNCLGYMEGSDHFPEIFVGRFNAATAAQLTLMINRNIDYEKTPLIDAAQNWCATGMVSGSNEGQGIGDDNQADYEQGNEWKAKHLADGFEKYWEFYDGNHASISPTPGDETADKSGDPVNTELTNLMNSRGVSLYNYCGHGWEQGLVSGNFNTDAVANLRNAHRYPIVIAVACCAGNFTNNSGGDCLGEALQRAGNPNTGEAWGGIAGFFSSDFQSWAPPMEGQDGMNQYLVDGDGVTLHPHLGPMEAYGNALMIAAYGQGGIDMADVWNPFCDPSTVPLTAMPKTLTATHANSLVIGVNSLLVSCPVEGALVSVFWKGQTLAVARVSGGQALLEFPALSDVGDMTVTATQVNYVPYQGTVNVVPGSGAFVVNQSITLDDTGGNGDQKADYGEKIALNLNLQNYGDAIANLTSATLETDDALVSISDNSEDFGDIPAGATASKDAAFAFTVADVVPDGKLVKFHLQLLFNSNQTYDAYFQVPLHAPKLNIGDIVIDDSQGGNGNHRLESGETALITIKNLNAGSSNSSDATGTLAIDAPWLDLGAPVALGALNSGGASADAVFPITVHNDAPQSAPVNFYYTLNAGQYSADKSFGPVLINPIIETFESHNYNSFPWQLSGNKPWLLTQGAYTGQFCSRSGAITHSQQSVMELTLDFTADGSVSFARRVSSEESYDFLRFYIDDVEMDAWSGLVAWSEVSYPLSAGTHKLSWIYAKDEVASANLDRAWVDDIILPPFKSTVGTTELETSGVRSTLAPNPASNSTRLGIHTETAQVIGVSLMDCLGHVLQTPQPPIRQAAGTTYLELNLESLPAGLYFVKVQAEEGSRVLRLMKE